MNARGKTTSGERRRCGRLSLGMPGRRLGRWLNLCGAVALLMFAGVAGAQPAPKKSSGKKTVPLVFPKATITGKTVVGPDDEEAAIDLVIPGVAPQTMVVRPASNAVLVPFEEFAAAAELVTLQASPTQWTGTLGKSGTALVLRVADQHASVGGVPIPVSPGQIATVDNRVFVHVDLLGPLTRSLVLLDWTDLTLRVRQADSLPVIRRLVRAAQYAAFYDRYPDGLAVKFSREDTLPVDRMVGRSLSPLGGLALDYGITTPMISERPDPTGTITAGVGILGGALNIGIRGTPGQALQSQTNWVTAYNTMLLRQVRIGEIGSSGLRFRPLTGGMISNAPYVRRSVVSTVEFDGRIEEGWSVEAWKGATLVAIDSTDVGGNWRLRLPVQMGENVYEFVAYGPDGSTRRFSRAYRMPSVLVAPWHVEYTGSAGVCTGLEKRCDRTANGDLRLGLPGWWSIGGGIDAYERDSLPRWLAPYARLQGPLTNAFSLEAAWLDRTYSTATLRFDPNSRIRLGVQHTLYAEDRRDAPWAPVGDLAQETNIALAVRPTWGDNRVVMDLAVDRELGYYSTRYIIRAAPLMRLGSVLAQPYTRLRLLQPIAGASQKDFLYGLRATVTPPRIIRQALGPVVLGLAAETPDFQKPTLLQATVFRTFWNMVRLAATVDVRGSNRPGFNVMVGLDRPWFRTLGTVVQAPRQDGSMSTELIESFTGGLTYDNTRRRATASALPSVMQGAVVGRAFIDANGNGIFDRGELPLAGVRLLSAAQSATSDGRGWYRIHGLVPFISQYVQIDSMAIPDPSYVPTLMVARVTPMANSSTRLDIPFVPAGTIEGAVQLAAGRPLAGVPVVATHAKSGRRYTVTTFSDGQFVFSNLIPGTYSVTVAPRVLATSSLLTEPVTVVLDHTGLVSDVLIKVWSKGAQDADNATVRPPGTPPDDSLSVRIGGIRPTLWADGLARASVGSGRGGRTLAVARW